MIPERLVQRLVQSLVERSFFSTPNWERETNEHKYRYALRPKEERSSIFQHQNDLPLLPVERCKRHNQLARFASTSGLRNLA